jgi:hypothetical protein
MQQVRADSAAGQDTVPTLPAQGESPPLPPLTEEQQREQVRKMNQWQAKRDMQELAARLEQEQSEREIGPWRSGGGRGWYIGSASDWKRRIKRK